MIPKVKRVSKKVSNNNDCCDIDNNENTLFTVFFVYEKLNESIIGQEQAKKTTALALVNNQRRVALARKGGEYKRLADNIIPKNILLSGSTGSGKTEIGRRIAEICDAPFIKVEMTKFTEVGYAGLDIGSMINDLCNHAVQEERSRQIKSKGEEIKNETAIEIGELIKKSHIDLCKDFELSDIAKKVRNGEFDDLKIEIDLNSSEKIFEIIDTSSFDDPRGGAFSIIPFIGNIDIGSSKKKKKVSVREAFKIIERRKMQKAINEEDIISKAIERVENKGIIFLDEIDKLITNRDSSGRGEVSREGVQRDLLSIVEGTSVSTSYGNISTDYILFIASGAFATNSPNDLMSELQGRFPMRAKLESLTVKDYYEILTKKKYNLIDQYQGLLSCSNIQITFTDKAIWEIAHSAEKLNINLGNLGARRLFSIMEALTEEISFEKEPQKEYTIKPDFVKKIFNKLNNDDVDLIKFVI